MLLYLKIQLFLEKAESSVDLEERISHDLGITVLGMVWVDERRSEKRSLVYMFIVCIDIAGRNSYADSCCCCCLVAKLCSTH